MDLGGRNSILGNSENDFCCKFNTRWNLMKEADGTKELIEKYNNIYTLYQTLVLSRLSLLVFGWIQRRKPYGSNFCFISNNSLILMK